VGDVFSADMAEEWWRSGRFEESEQRKSCHVYQVRRMGVVVSENNIAGAHG
jgi:hypothetical protein